MSSFLYRLGQRCARHPVRVLGIWIIVAIAVLGLNQRLGGEVKDNFTVPGVEAQRADDVLTSSFPELSGNSGQIVFHVDTGTLADAGGGSFADLCAVGLQRAATSSGLASAGKAARMAGWMSHGWPVRCSRRG